MKTGRFNPKVGDKGKDQREDVDDDEQRDPNAPEDEEDGDGDECDPMSKGLDAEDQVAVMDAEEFREFMTEEISKSVEGGFRKAGVRKVIIDALKEIMASPEMGEVIAKAVDGRVGPIRKEVGELSKTIDAFTAHVDDKFDDFATEQELISKALAGGAVLTSKPAVKPDDAKTKPDDTELSKAVDGKDGILDPNLSGGAEDGGKGVKAGEIIQKAIALRDSLHVPVPGLDVAYAQFARGEKIQPQVLDLLSKSVSDLETQHKPG